MSEKSILTSHVGSINAESISSALLLQYKAGIDIFSDGQIYFAQFQDDYLPYFIDERGEIRVSGLSIKEIRESYDTLILTNTTGLLQADSPSAIVAVDKYIKAKEELDRSYSSKEIKFIIYSPLSLACRVTYTDKELSNEKLTWNNGIRDYLPYFKKYCLQLLNYIIKHEGGKYTPDFIQIDQPVLEDYNLYGDLLLQDLQFVDEIAKECGTIPVIHYTPSNLEKLHDEVKKGYKNLKSFSWFAFDYTQTDNQSFFKKDEVNSFEFPKKLCLGLINSYSFSLDNEKDVRGLLNRALYTMKYSRNNIMISPNSGMKGLRNRSLIQNKLKLLSKIAKEI